MRNQITHLEKKLLIFNIRMRFEFFCKYIPPRMVFLPNDLSFQFFNNLLVVVTQTIFKIIF